jgi:hypothetical protein
VNLVDCLARAEPKYLEPAWHGAMDAIQDAENEERERAEAARMAPARRRATAKAEARVRETAELERAWEFDGGAR